MATAMFPCQKSTFGILFTLLYGNGKVGANIVALMTPNTIIHSHGCRLYLLVQFQNFLRANTDTQSAPLTPFFVHDNAELL